MQVIKLSKSEQTMVADAIADARFEVLVAIDEIDQSFKVKIDGGTWSPPLGTEVK